MQEALSNIMLKSNDSRMCVHSMSAKLYSGMKENLSNEEKLQKIQTICLKYSELSKKSKILEKPIDSYSDLSTAENKNRKLFEIYQRIDSSLNRALDSMGLSSQINVNHNYIKDENPGENFSTESEVLSETSGYSSSRNIGHKYISINSISNTSNSNKSSDISEEECDDDLFIEESSNVIIVKRE